MQVCSRPFLSGTLVAFVRPIPIFPFFLFKAGAIQFPISTQRLLGFDVRAEAWEYVRIPRIDLTKSIWWDLFRFQYLLNFLVEKRKRDSFGTISTILVEDVTQGHLSKHSKIGIYKVRWMGPGSEGHANTEAPAGPVGYKAVPV